MKSKKVLITAVVAVVFLTVALFVIVFSMQNAKAQQSVPIEDTAEELPTEAVTEEPAETTETEIPEKATEAEEPAETPEQPADLSVGEEEATETEEPAETQEVSAAEARDGQLRIGRFTQSEKKLKPSEVVDSNWKAEKPGAADITEDQAIETAKQAGKEIFGLKDTEISSAEFQKDKTGQRASYWMIQFKEDGLLVEIDSLSGNIARAYSETRRSDKTKRENLGKEKFSKMLNDIAVAEESAQGGEYTAATKAVAEKFIDGKVEKYMLNAVHGDGEHYPLVSIDVIMEDGTVYEFEWSRENAKAEPKICSMDAFPSWDHFMEWTCWDVDMILLGHDPV